MKWLATWNFSSIFVNFVLMPKFVEFSVYKFKYLLHFLLETLFPLECVTFLFLYTKFIHISTSSFVGYFLPPLSVIFLFLCTLVFICKVGLVLVGLDTWLLYNFPFCTSLKDCLSFFYLSLKINEAVCFCSERDSHVYLNCLPENL